MSTNTERFLERATAGLATDPELRLDVQAELRSHIEEKTAELGGEEHADEAVASLGGVVELAEEVSEANQRRLGWRNLARRLLRFGLVPVSVVCALWLVDFSGVLVAGYFLAPYGSTGEQPSAALSWFRRFEPKRSEHALRVLQADGYRPGEELLPPLRETDPTPLWHAAYVSWVGTTRPESLERAGAADPENSRYPLRIAIAQIRKAAELEEEKGASEGEETTYRLELRDRKALDAAMAELLEAAAMPEYNCYYRELWEAKLAALGPPERLADATRRALTSSIFLPDLTELYSASRCSLAYAQLLIAEGRGEEAIVFLRIPEVLAEKVARNSFALIWVLVPHAIIHMALETVPEALRQLGREEEARNTEQRLAAIRRPREQWQDERNASMGKMDESIRQLAGWVASQFLHPRGPSWALLAEDSEFRDGALADQFGNGRLLESTVATQVLVSLLGILMLAGMLLCLVVSLRWRYLLGSQAAPLLLLPSWRDMVRFVVLGIVLPMAAFWAWTRWLPFSGHAYSIAYAGHRTAVEFLALTTALLFLPTWLSLRAYRRRCAELDLSSALFLPGIVYGALAIAGVLLAVGFLMPLGATHSLGRGLTLAAWGGGAVVVALLSVFVLALVAPPPRGRCLGTLSRSLIPVFASAILILSLLVQPLLRVRERRLLRADRVLWADDTPGEFRAGSECRKRFREETLKAMAENPMPTIPTTEAQP
jgi:hypothetical protein